MKHFCMILFMVLSIPFALNGADTTVQENAYPVALPPERVSISTGESQRFEVPFVIERFRSSTPNVRVGLMEGRAFEIEGVAAGNAVVTVWSQGISKEFRVTVSSSLMPIYRELSRELGDLPEVSVELMNDSLSLRGEITRTTR